MNRLIKIKYQKEEGESDSWQIKLLKTILTTTRVHKKVLFCARQFLILCVEQPYLYTCIGNSPRNAPSALRANASNSSSPGYTYTGAMNDMRSFNRLIT